LLVRTVVVPGIRDSQCGFKLFSATAAESLFRAQTLDGWCFDVELLFLARERGLRVVELDVEWREAGRGRIRLGRDALGMTRDLLRIRWSSLRGRYRTTPHGNCGDLR
jgi:dolichyl-phosphate beta-glucosyltransferase